MINMATILKTVWLTTYILLCLCINHSFQNCPQIYFTAFSQHNCTSRTNHDQSGKSFYYYLEQNQNCVPSCKEYEASYSSSRLKCQVNDCPPAYHCEQRCSGGVDDRQKKCKVNADCNTGGEGSSFCSWYCIPDDKGCMAYHANTEEFKDTYFSARKFKPECDENGTWKAKQCKGGVNGRCMCYDTSGKRLFGEAPRSESSDMTCACSRKKADLMASGKKYLSFHCDGKGNFETLQCDIDIGMCWCADPQTGDPVSPVVPEKAMIKLPCYGAAEIGGQYLRQCESKDYAIKKIKEVLQLRGIRYYKSEFTLCDGDGAYGAYNVIGGRAYCTWRDGSKISPYQADPAAKFEFLNCNCARDLKRYNHNLDCESYGNYKALQTFQDDRRFLYYCVDDDGFAKTDLSEDKSVNCNLYY